MQGIFHAYYTVALAPAVGALVGMGAVTALWSYLLLRRTPDWHPRLAPLVLVGGLAVAALAGPAAWSLDTAATPRGDGRMGGSMGGSDAARQITAWVQERFRRPASAGPPSTT